MSLNPLKSTATFSRYGLQWFAEQIHLENLPDKKTDFGAELDRAEQRCDSLLTSSPLLSDLDLNIPPDVEIGIARLKEKRDTPEWWTLLMGTYLAIVKDSIAIGDAQQAAWAMACAERCRSMLVFKEHLEEVVWMGQSAKRVVDILRIWDANQTSDDEAFWQLTFREHAYALAQVFAVPLVFIKESAYVGGMNIDRRDAKLVDYLVTLDSSHEAALVEIKTPATKLLGPKYRGTHRPSNELAGAVMQALDYRRSLMTRIESLLAGAEYRVNAVAPRCVVIVGNAKLELNSDEKRTAFELFRRNSRDVDIITYDELFKKLDVLAHLFNLRHETPPVT
jgi:hypothetical protein